MRPAAGAYPLGGVTIMLVQQLHWARTEERDLEDLAIEQDQLVGLDLSHLE